MINIVQDKKSKESKVKKEKKRNIILQSYNNIKYEIEIGKENKENIPKNSLNSPIKASLINEKFKLARGQTPIISKNKKIILITEDKYDKTLQRGKSPFFISDKVSFRNEFIFLNKVKEVKNKHLGLCDFYSKNKENEIKLLIDDEVEYDFSKTPRFHRNEN